MKFTVTTVALFAVGAFAESSGHGLAARVAGRNRLSHPKQTNNTNTDYSSNWSGAVLTSPPSGTTFTSVSAQFTVPTPQAVNGKAGSSSAWVGIDGDTYTAAILQTGIDFSVDSSGAASFDAWYEWFPDYAYDFSGIDINAGDTIAVSVVANSNTSGTATIENLSTAQTNAEWIVEDYESGGSLVTLDNFGTVTFTSASAGLSNGESVGTDGADLIDLEQNRRVLTSVSVPSSSEVVVTYV
uniref:Aspergillopepsin-2 n=1 Tax=Talaromyces marneffei PM1 TaxID=1077442 RepID=A0A093X7Q5_TALMA